MFFRNKLLFRLIFSLMFNSWSIINIVSSKYFIIELANVKNEQLPSSSEDTAHFRTLQVERQNCHGISGTCLFKNYDPRDWNVAYWRPT